MKRITTRLQSALTTNSEKKLITSFAERCGMVYFGFVSQLRDEHRMVRGLTVSTRHRDRHYCIGTYEGYNVTFVERSDRILTNHRHKWHILEFELKTTADHPHLFIGSDKHGLGFHALLKAKYPIMKPLPLGTTGEYPAVFTDYFRVYTRPTHAVEAEQLVTPEIAGLLGEHFKGLAAEVAQHSVYVYSEHEQITSRLLDVMMANGIWLAKAIDKKYQA